jgi:hypothetical protein
MRFFKEQWQWIPLLQQAQAARDKGTSHRSVHDGIPARDDLRPAQAK